MSLVQCRQIIMTFVLHSLQETLNRGQIYGMQRTRCCDKRGSCWHNSTKREPPCNCWQLLATLNLLSLRQIQTQFQWSWDVVFKHDFFFFLKAQCIYLNHVQPVLNWVHDKDRIFNVQTDKRCFTLFLANDHSLRILGRQNKSSLKKKKSSLAKIVLSHNFSKGKGRLWGNPKSCLFFFSSKSFNGSIFWQTEIRQWPF